MEQKSSPPPFVRRSGAVPNLQRLTGREWLRLLMEFNLSILAVWCPTCGNKQVQDDTREISASCPRCGTARLRLDAPFWERVSVKIKRAIQRDRSLMATVKAEWESIREGSPLLSSPPYPFPQPLSWLTALWEQAGRPSGRPVQMGYQYRWAYMMEVLSDLRIELEEALKIAHQRDDEKRPVDGSQKNSVDLLRQALGGLDENFEDLFGYPADPVERWRTRQWVERQRTNPMARLSGERVKDTKALTGGPGRLPKALPRPTARDLDRFRMVSIWVRQDGQTKRKAMKRIAQLEGIPDKTDAIGQSLARVEQYIQALAKQRKAGTSKPPTQ